ncbi:hypothetical protein HZH68_016486 [Vespula germanica]|uniref:Uncharacterized protein n=1 Tax=Vespula germanica TaxID=30212 RepID=A0A834J3V2_VESGE|nr:hypothetical protein HZH68_016486 [Vespula germanica]
MVRVENVLRSSASSTFVHLGVTYCFPLFSTRDAVCTLSFDHIMSADVGQERPRDRISTYVATLNTLWLTGAPELCRGATLLQGIDDCA